jgi:hypothetical protein
MMAAAYLPLSVERNGVYVDTWQISDDNGAPIDLTSATLKMAFKYSAGEPDPPLALATLTVVEAAAGKFTVYIPGPAFGAVPGVMDIVVLAYDLVIMRSGTPIVYATGPLTLLPGVTLISGVTGG